MPDDRYDLERFIRAQADGYDAVLEQLRSGRKRGHWMWYIFPQIEGLGSSFMSQKYAISCGEEARLYSAHSVLGGRLRECTDAVLNVEGRTARQIFGGIDSLKFRSCMTLFEHSAADPEPYGRALQRYYGGERDRRTLEILATTSW